MSSHQKRKQNLSNPQLPNIHNRNPMYNHRIFTAKDYTNFHEKIQLPLETKFGTVIDLSFVHELEALFKWCNKPSSLSPIITSASEEPEIKLNLTFNEILYHILEGSLVKPNSIFKKSDEKSDTQSTGENRIANPYDIINARNSPIYAEIPDMINSLESPFKGKLKILITTNVVFMKFFYSNH